LETGQCTSRLASLVTHWQNLVNLRTKDSVIVKKMAEPEHVVEFNPGLSASMSPTNRAYLEGAHPSAYFPNITVGRPPGGPETSPLVAALTAVTNFQSTALHKDYTVRVYHICEQLRIVVTVFVLAAC